MKFRAPMSILSGALMIPRINQGMKGGRESTPATMTPVRTPMPSGEADHARTSAVTESKVMSGA